MISGQKVSTKPSLNPLSARAFHRILKPCRTIADPSASSWHALAGADAQTPHPSASSGQAHAEALQFGPGEMV